MMKNLHSGFSAKVRRSTKATCIPSGQQLTPAGSLQMPLFAQAFSSTIHHVPSSPVPAFSSILNTATILPYPSLYILTCVSVLSRVRLFALHGL